MAQVLQIRAALCEDLIQRRAERAPTEAHRIQKVALARAVRADQNGEWTKRHIASGDALVVLQSYAGYSALSCHESPTVWLAAAISIHPQTAAPAPCVRSAHATMAGAGNALPVSHRNNRLSPSWPAGAQPRRMYRSATWPFLAVGMYSPVMCVKWFSAAYRTSAANIASSRRRPSTRQLINQVSTRRPPPSGIAINTPVKPLSPKRSLARMACV